METGYTLQSLLATWLLSSWLIFAGIVAWAAVAANSPWMTRCLGVILVCAPALLAGAYEVFWLLIAIVALSAAIITRLSWGADRTERLPERRNLAGAKFSIGTFLFITALSAGAIAIALRTPALDLRTWLSLLLICVATSLIVVTANCVNRPRRARTIVVISGIAAIVTAIPLSLFDWVLVSLHTDIGWPPDPTFSTSGLFGVAPPRLHPEWMWFGVTSTVSLCLVLWKSSRSMVSGIRRFLIAAGLAMVVFPPWLLSLQLLYVPDFADETGKENAYPQVAALSARIANSSFESAISQYGDWEAIPTADRLRMLVDLGPELDDLSEQLQRPIRAPLDFSMDDMPMEDVKSFRAATRAFVARARVQNDTLLGKQDCLSAVHLGVRVRRGGLLIQHLVGMACTGLGLRELYLQQRTYEDAACLQVMRQVAATLGELEPVDSILQTERTWMMRQGWHNHLHVLFSEWAGEPITSVDQDYLERLFLKEKTVMQLLATDMALQCYQRQHHDLPQSLEMLVPDWLPNAPQDFLAGDNGLLKYQVFNDDYLLDSVGINGIDENGVVPEYQEMYMEGDLRLDGIFAEPAGP